MRKQPDSGTRKIEFRLVTASGENLGQFAYRATAQRAFEVEASRGRSVAIVTVPVAWT